MGKFTKEMVNDYADKLLIGLTDEEQDMVLEEFDIIDKNIDIIRIGLQNTEEISDPKNEGSEVVAGPYHPAFRQLVESAMWYDAIVGKIKKLNAKVKEVEVSVNPIDSNNVIGHKKENVIKLKNLILVVM